MRASAPATPKIGPYTKFTPEQIAEIGKQQSMA